MKRYCGDKTGRSCSNQKCEDCPDVRYTPESPTPSGQAGFDLLGAGLERAIEICGNSMECDELELEGEKDRLSGARTCGNNIIQLLKDEIIIVRS